MQNWERPVPIIRRATRHPSAPFRTGSSAHSWEKAFQRTDHKQAFSLIPGRRMARCAPDEADLCCLNCGLFESSRRYEAFESALHLYLHVVEGDADYVHAVAFVHLR